MRHATFPAILAAVAVAFIVSDLPVVQVVHAEAAREGALDQALLLLGVQGAIEGPFSGLPNTRDEADGSTTFLNFIEDQSGPMARNMEVNGTTGLGVATGGTFARSWMNGAQPITTIGVWVEDQDSGDVTNFNLLALESADPHSMKDFPTLLADLFERDVAPFLVNSAPYVVNWAHPSSTVLLLALLLAILAVAIVAGLLAGFGYGELGTMLVYSWFFLALSPIFMANILYPYHTDPYNGEVYRDFPDLFVWRGVRQVGSSALWDGAYLSRWGSYSEAVEVRADNSTHLLASAWKRDVVGPAVRLDATTQKLPGVYVNQTIERDFAVLASGNQTFDANQTLRTGLYDPLIGESPGAVVRMEEHKEGEQVFFYPPAQQDTISVGVGAGDDYVPLVGTRTSSTHRAYTDTTNLGQPIAAIEHYRVTTFGFYAAGAYTPVFGFDYWGERNPTDLWALFFALNLQGLGDQYVGDWQVRTGYVSPTTQRLMAVAGTRFDDDFAGHLYSYRTMVSAGLFVNMDPLDPGPAVPGEAPDQAMYVPLVATAYDGKAPIVPWALADVGNNPSGMPTWLASAGLGGPQDYKALVGAEFVPDSYQNDRAARETYRLGVFPAAYSNAGQSLFIPLVGARYNGDRTIAGEAQAAPAVLAGGSPGPFETTVGVYNPAAGDAFVPVLEADYTGASTGGYPYGHEVVLGAYANSPTPTPLLRVFAGSSQPPSTWGPGNAPCVAVVATVVPTNTVVPVTPPCV